MRTPTVSSRSTFCPGDFDSEIANSTLLNSIQPALDPSFTAIAESTLYLTSSIGMLGGVAGVGAVLQQSLRVNLDARLTKIGFEEYAQTHVGLTHFLASIFQLTRLKVIESAVSDVQYIERVKHLIAEVIVSPYVETLSWTPGKLRAIIC
jgi:hypothetical protein